MTDPWFERAELYQIKALADAIGADWHAGATREELIEAIRVKRVKNAELWAALREGRALP
jgi:hypothetical protein